MNFQSKSDEHDKTNEENICREENEVQNLQFGARNKATKENNSKPCPIFIGDSIIK